MKTLLPSKDQSKTAQNANSPQKSYVWSSLHAETRILLTLKKTNFSRLSPNDFTNEGIPFSFEEAFRLPGSKSPLIHFIYILFAWQDRVELVVHSKSLLAEADISNYTSKALDFSSNEINGSWVRITHQDKENIVLKATLYVGEIHHFQTLLWQTCAGLDASFKSKAAPLQMDVPLLEEATLEKLIRLHLNRVGFKKIKEMNLPSDSKAFLVVLSNESDSVDDCWKRFPMRFEITSKDIITLRVYVSVHDKAHFFEKSLLKEAISMVAWLNSHIPEGFYLLDTSYNQVHLIFRIICANNLEDNVRILLQDYYEAAITVYKWSAWAFVQLAQLGEKKALSPGDIASIRSQVIARSPNERKCIVLNYDKKERLQFEEDKSALEKISGSSVLAKYLIPEAFLIPKNEMCVKVFTDTSLHSLEQGFREGTSAGTYITTTIFRLFDEFSQEGVYPRLEMIKYKPSPMRLVFIPAKNFAKSIVECYGAFQALVAKCAIDSERELLFSPEVSLLYINPDNFHDVLQTPTGPKVKAKLAGNYYLLWRLKKFCVTKRYITFLEGYIAEVQSRLGERTIEGFMATEDERFEDKYGDGEAKRVYQPENIPRFYFVESRYTDILSPSSDTALREIKQLSIEVARIHTAGCFHGFICQATARCYRANSEMKVSLSLPCLDWKYIAVIYPAIQESQMEFLAPEIKQTYITQEPPAFSTATLQKSDIYSLAKLISYWAPSYREHPAVLAATSEDWMQRPTLQGFVKSLEEDRERSTLQTQGSGEVELADISIDPEKNQVALNSIRDFETMTVEAKTINYANRESSTK